MNGHCLHGHKHHSEHGSWQQNIDKLSPSCSFQVSFPVPSLCIFAGLGREGLSFCLSKEVTSAHLQCRFDCLIIPLCTLFTLAPGDPSLRFRRSFHNRGFSRASARSITRQARPCVWSVLLMYAFTPELLQRTFISSFLWSNDQTKKKPWDETTTGDCLLFFLLRSLRLTKMVLKPKKKRPRKRSSRVSGGLLVSEVFKREKNIAGRPTRSTGRSPLRKPKRHRLSLKERSIFLVTLIVQDFDRRYNPSSPFIHTQANLTRREQRH